MTSEFEMGTFQVIGSLKVTKFHGKPVSILECIKHQPLNKEDLLMLLGLPKFQLAHIQWTHLSGQIYCSNDYLFQYCKVGHLSRAIKLRLFTALSIAIGNLGACHKK